MPPPAPTPPPFGRDPDEVVPAVYAELRQLAAVHLGRERPGHTLQPTALVHEAYLKLAGGLDDRPRSRAQFLALAAHAVRQVLVDHARARGARKRGGDVARVTLMDGMAETGGVPVDLLDLDAALGRLADLSPRQARVVELRFFGGLTDDEAADVLDVSARTVRNDWTVARAWLWRELGGTA